LIIRTPWLPNSVGEHTSAFAELVDLHPTLLGLAGLPRVAPAPLPAAIEAQGTGQDLSPLFENPDLAEAQPGKTASFSQWPVCTNISTKMCMGCACPIGAKPAGTCDHPPPQPPPPQKKTRREEEEDGGRGSGSSGGWPEHGYRSHFPEGFMLL